MTIDWITVSAQIINFLVLVWLLKHFLYQPVIRAMDKREQRVTQRLKDAEQREQTATELGNSYSEQQVELQQNRDQVLQDARDQADKIKHELMDQARDDVAKTRERWQQQVELEKQQFIESLQQKVVHSVLKVARKAMTDLANTDLETQVVSTFLSNLQTLEQAEIERLQQAAGPITVKSSFELDKPSRQKISEAIQALLKTDAQSSFESLSGKGWGIELDIAEQRLGWNIESYLDDFSAKFDKSLTSSNR